MSSMLLGYQKKLMVRKGLVKSSLLITIVLVITSSVSSQERTSAGTIFENPARVGLTVNPRDYRRNGSGGTFEIEKFYPVGWSKDGKFAYYVEPVDEACGCYFGKLLIVDLKTDAVLWQFDYTSEEDEKPESNKPTSLVALWNANRTLFSDKLDENKIRPLHIAGISPFPISYKADAVASVVRIERKPATEVDRIYGNIARVKVQLHSRRQGQKLVLNREYAEVRPLYVGVVGYLRSPFEPRVAIILVEVYRGYEGPPHVAKLRIVGASLGTNFR